jgi:hypothetical protein
MTVPCSESGENGRKGKRCELITSSGDVSTKYYDIKQDV